MTHEKIIQKFIDEHYPALKDITIKEIKLYETDDLIFSRPLQGHTKWADDTDNNETEYDGIQMIFTSKEAVPIKDLANICNILCYGVAWAISPDYGGCDISEFKETLNGELDTCWHHTQITKVTDSYNTEYTIQQGFCMCS